MNRNHPERIDQKRLSRPDKHYVLHRDGLSLPMSDGVRLSADLYLPSGPGPWPVLLERTPYNKEASVEVTQVGSPEYFASRGYAVVIQDTRGRFNSEGEFYPFRDDGWGENRDGYDTVEAIAKQKWCNGRVGTLGGSYAGHTQYAMAPTAPPHLAAQFVRHSIDDFHDGWIFRGGSFELRFNLDWALVQSLSQVEREITDVAERSRRKQEIEDALERRSDWYEYLPLREIPLLKGIAPWYYDWLEHPDQGKYWQRWNVATGYEHVDAPICHFGSWFDTFLKGTINNFNGISARAHSPRARHNQRMILGPWFHGPTTSAKDQVRGLRVRTGRWSGLQLPATALVRPVAKGHGYGRRLAKRPILHDGIEPVAIGRNLAAKGLRTAESLSISGTERHRRFPERWAAYG